MKNTIFEAITQAIDEHRLLLVLARTGPRVLEPYLLFESLEGDMLLHGWQQGGAFDAAPPPDWCNLFLDDIQNIQVLAEHFPEPHRGYNPGNADFYRIVYAIETAPPRHDRLARGSPLRLKRERRGPPLRRTDGANPHFRRRLR